MTVSHRITKANYFTDFTGLTITLVVLPSAMAEAILIRTTPIYLLMSAGNITLAVL